jgi:hypothetical protein
MNINKRIVFRWLKVIIILYCGIGIALYYLQRKFLFHPQKLDQDHVFSFKGLFEEVKLPVNKEDTLCMIKFFPTGNYRKGVVVYYHGNRENVERYATYASNFTRHGYEVWMPDYPGFGKSTGELTEKKLYAQAYMVQQMAAAKYHSDSIVIYGKSLGTGIAAYAASASKCRRLILETPYYSIPDLFSSYAWIYPTRYMSEFSIPTGEFLADVSEPVTIFHGDDDEVIPYRCAAKLKENQKPTDQFITIADGRHNNLPDKPRFKAVLDSLLKL